MLISELPFLQNHWYPVAKLDELDSPRRVRLFDRPYLAVPTDEGSGRVLAAAPDWRTPSTVPSRARYGLLWACVGDAPSDGPPAWPEADDAAASGWRVMTEFFEEWNCSALRIIDNNLDNSHVAFVHRTTFGDPEDARWARPELHTGADGYFHATLCSAQRGLGVQLGVTGDETERFSRMSTTRLLAPLTTSVRMEFEQGGPDYAFYGTATPIDDHRSIYVRLTALEGSEEDQPWEPFHAFGTRVKEEDRVILESTIPDFPIDSTTEVHLRCDNATLAYRRTLSAHLRDGGRPTQKDPISR